MIAAVESREFESGLPTGSVPESCRPEYVYWPASVKLGTDHVNGGGKADRLVIEVVWVSPSPDG